MIDIVTLLAWVLVVSLFLIFCYAILNANVYGEKFSTGIGDKHGDNHPSKKDCKKSDTLKEFAKKVDAEKCENNDIKNFKSYNFYKLEDKETKECIEKRAEMANNLDEYEPLNCFSDTEYEYKGGD